MLFSLLAMGVVTIANDPQRAGPRRTTDAATTLERQKVPVDCRDAGGMAT
jgi:hypothetical protein